MSKRESLVRYSMIINMLRKKPRTFEEIREKLQYESEIHGYDYERSARTFLRDRDEIRSMYDIDIQYDFSLRKYRIAEDDSNETNMRMLEAFDTFNALNSGDSLLRYVQLEKRKPLGTEHIYGLLHAIRNRQVVRFAYKKYGSEITQTRQIEPYLLKEFRQRWYVVGKDTNKKEIRIFGLDRMSMIDIRMEKFSYPKDFKPGEYFRHSFGIIGPNDISTETVELSISPMHGKYIKSLPLHESQEIIRDNEKELRVRLNIRPTYDFRMELLSYGDNVKVIKPMWLKNIIKENIQKALANYK